MWGHGTALGMGWQVSCKVWTAGAVCVLQAVPSVPAPPASVLLWVGAWAWGSLGTLLLGAGSRVNGTAALALLTAHRRCIWGGRGRWSIGCTGWD